MPLDSKIPSGPLAEKWYQHKRDSKLINPKNKRKFTGHRRRQWPGRSQPLRLRSRELGYNVKCFCYQDTPASCATPLRPRAGSMPRRTIRTTATAFIVCSTTPSKAVTSGLVKATCIASPRSSTNVIDQCVAQGVPFAREYGGMLGKSLASVARRSAARFMRAARPASSSCSVLIRRLEQGDRERRARADVFRAARCWTCVTVDGHAKGIITRDLVTGKIEAHAG